MRRITPSSAKICKRNNFSAVLLRAVCDALNPDPQQLTPSVSLSCIYPAELKSTSIVADTQPEAVSGGIRVPVPSQHKPYCPGKQSCLQPIAIRDDISLIRQYFGKNRLIARYCAH